MKSLLVARVCWKHALVGLALVVIALSLLATTGRVATEQVTSTSAVEFGPADGLPAPAVYPLRAP